MKNENAVDTSSNISREVTDLTLDSEIGNIAKGAFIVDIGHRLREPMNSVLGMLRMLDNSHLDAHQKEYVSTAFDACESLIKILDDISAFPVSAYDTPMELGSFNVAKACKDVIRALETTIIDREVSLSFDHSSDAPEFVIGDELKIQQVLAKILERLLEHTERGSVGLRFDASRNGSEGVELTFTITSHFPSILGASSLKELTDFPSPKWDSNPDDRRASLELAVCLLMTKRMGGDIRFSPTPKTEFAITLPVKTPSQEEMESLQGDTTAEKDQASWTPVAPGRYNGTRILLAEDDPINQGLGVAFLTNLGASVDVADNGMDAVGKFESGDYDLIFMDCDMPVMDGFDATSIIREKEKETGEHIPIVATTAYARQGDKENCIAAGMDAHVPKPITVDILKEIADQFLSV